MVFIFFMWFFSVLIWLFINIALCCAKIYACYSTFLFDHITSLIQINLVILFLWQGWLLPSLYLWKYTTVFMVGCQIIGPNEEFYELLPEPIHIDRIYQLIKLFLPWQWQFTARLRELENSCYPQFSYNIYDHQKYYPVKPVGINLRSLIILSTRTIWWLPQKMVQVNFHYLVVKDNW